MATVTGKLVGGNPSQSRIEIELADVTGTRAIGYAASEEAEVVRPVVVKPQTDGTWSADLIPNAQIQADAGDTVWAVMEGRSYDGTPVMTSTAPWSTTGASRPRSPTSASSRSSPAASPCSPGPSTVGRRWPG